MSTLTHLVNPDSTSLMVLGKVISALVEERKHVPFLESQLTRVLHVRLELGGSTTTCATVTSDAIAITDFATSELLDRELLLATPGRR